MKFCEKCFKTVEIQAIIKSIGTKGDCDLNPEHRNVNICDSTVDTGSIEDIKNFLRQIIDIYTIESELPVKFPDNKKNLLKNSLENKWSLFTLKDDKIHSLLEHLFKNDEDFDEQLLSKQVGVPEEMDTANDLLIIQNNDWREFTESIKYKNRFHTKTINLEKLEYFLSFTTKTIKKVNGQYHRCRISNSKNLAIKDLGAPPKGQASPGRLNPEWISALYLSDSKETCVQEVRATFQDEVYVGTFNLKRDIRVADLRNFEDITLVGEVDNPDDKLLYYLNRDTLAKIAAEFSKPTNNDYKQIDYLPLQYISDYVKTLNIGYDGILYRSVMDNEASNLVLFDPDLVECASVKKTTVKELRYKLVPKL